MILAGYKSNAHLMGPAAESCLLYTSMLSMTRKILEEGRKEGFDIGYLKGLMAAQSKE